VRDLVAAQPASLTVYAGGPRHARHAPRWPTSLP